ncbi:helix-turn-helix transcriptional regulator [Streptomyces xinghaiensis]|uniref:helix-turn-helix domain-containing protein n=1 Tax=Streptomyces xinghaiensis TaxID=1038928 RepID=UPI002E111E5A|nr:helix-turn-helix domain-containing protein [Streptomyces xinghaiensis]
MAVMGRPELPDGDGTGSFLKSFGAQIRVLRTRAGLTQAELGQQLQYGEDLISSVERGRRIARPEFIDKVDEGLDAGGLLKVMKQEVARARYPAFFRDAARIEEEAIELTAYDSLVINGLLQTEDYARAVLSMYRPLVDDETIEQRVAARLERQEIFSRRPAPLLGFVVEEAVLRRPLGGREVLHGQLEQLLVFGRMRNVEIQVMPTERADHAGLDGPFTLMETTDQQRIAYMAVQNVSRLATDRRTVQELEARYGILRAQALTPDDSLAFIEKLLGDV